MAIRKPLPEPKKRRQRTTKDQNAELVRDLIAIGKRVPKDVLASLPRDLAENFDHYHDGSPRQD
jgi:hypothetical protein